MDDNEIKNPPAEETNEETGAEEAPVVETTAASTPAPANMTRQDAPQVVAPAPVAPSAEQETVVLSREAFDAFIADFNKMKSDHQALMSVQSKNDLNRIEEMRRSGKLVKSVKVRKVNGKFVIGWKLLQDEVYVDVASGRLVEKQNVAIFLEGEEAPIELNMRQWVMAAEYVPFDVIRESRDENGDLFFLVKGEDGKEFEINAIYVN